MHPIKLIRSIRSAPQTARGLTDDEVCALRALPYEQYLLTPWWRTRRNRALQQAGYRCARCSSKRELQVHHLTYERLGAELDTDLEVLCRGCHLGEHFNEVQTYVSLYVRIISGVVADGQYRHLSDVLEESKMRCARFGLPYRSQEFQAAVSRVLPRVPFTPPPDKADLFQVGRSHQPLTRAEAAGVLSRLKAAGLIRHMPEVRVPTMRELECRRALKIVAQAIVDQVQRCEEAEIKRCP